MKVLVATGRLAQDLVKESSQDADVLVLDLDVAAFITPEMLRRAAPAGYDLILIPGSITADFRRQSGPWAQRYVWDRSMRQIWDSFFATFQMLNCPAQFPHACSWRTRCVKTPLCKE